MNLFSKIFCRENLWNLFYLFVLESLMFIRYFLGQENLVYAIIVLIILVFFNMMEKKGKVTVKGFNGFYLLLILARRMEWAVYAAMIFPLAGFIYQMAKKEE